MTQREWLPHLINSIPEGVHGYTLSMYSIALEGWRRGLELTFYNKNRSKAHTEFALRDKDNTHLFSVTRSSVVPKEAVKICVNKNLTKDYLNKANVPTPEGRDFDETNTEDEMISYANTLGYPLVLKPSDGTGGNGVIANIKNEEELKKAISYVKHELGFTKLIIEKYFKGEDYRLYVIGDMVVGGIKRIPANIIGDGKSTIRELIKVKNKERYNSPALYKRGIKIDKEMYHMLGKKGYTLESIPSKDERIFLKSKNNVSAGGESVDVTDDLTEEIKLIAIHAAKAIPGLVQCGVDIMVNKKENTGVILEINSRPHITAQLFPWEGKARDIPKAIIDYYFPETTANHNHPAYYFDFQIIFEAFQNGYMKEVTLPNIPKGELGATRFVVSGKVQHVNYGKWVRKQALRLKLNGYITHLKNDDSSIVVSGKNKAINEFREIIKHKKSKRAEITNIIEKHRKSPVKIGFEIIDLELDKTKKNQQKSSENETLQKDKVKQLTNEKNYYRKKYEQMKTSTSWKVTGPFRKIIGKFK